MTVRRLATTAALVGTLALAACSSSSGGAGASSGASSGASTASAPAASASPTGSGPVDVYYAGSLVDLMEKQVGPAFKTATGYTFTGYSGGSSALATQIKGKVHPGDVFISASPSVNATLMGPSNGNWVSWYGTFASSALVLGYNPNSKFAADLKTKPWYDVVTESGFRLGSTDPASDPKGKLAAQALQDTGKTHPAVAAVKPEIDPEETLVGRLQTGQLDAAFFYAAEATAANIQTVPLQGVDLAASYTVTVLNQAPHEQAAEAFVKYLLGPDGAAVLTKDGYVTSIPAKVSGTGAPSSLSTVLAE